MKISDGLEAGKYFAAFFRRILRLEAEKKLCDKFAVFGKENRSLRKNS